MKQKLLLYLLMSFLFIACNKEEDITVDMGARLSFAMDSVLFDTVFTSVGSANRRLKIYNHNPKAIHLSHIKLGGGSDSPFSLNINGQATDESTMIKLNGKDSINIFVKVNINPNQQNLPFIVQDSILFFYNGNKKTVTLVAYGQNANFITNGSIKTNTTWNSKMPYLIYNALSIEEGANLTIAAGSKVLFHSNATMNVKGTLNVEGTKTAGVLFASDRLEKIYSEEPGQWNGIHFYPQSKNSKINFAMIKNGVAGITVDSLSTNTQPKLLLTNSIVKNMEVVGFLGYQTELSAFNNLFFNCGQYLLYGVGGGKYNLKQNTFAGYNPNYARKTAAVYLSDFISSTQADHLTLDLQNNIIWGGLANEFTLAKKLTTTTLNTIIKNNILKNEEGIYLKDGNIVNVDPLFIAPALQDFSLHVQSPAAKKGIDLNTDFYYALFLKKDLNGNKRLFPSDIGCYEIK